MKILLLLTTSLAFSSVEYNVLEEGVTEQLTASEVAEIKTLGGKRPSFFAGVTDSDQGYLQRRKSFPIGKWHPGNSFGFRSQAK